MQPPLFSSSGPDYQPVVTLNGWTLPWRMNGGWKEFHLVAEPVIREFAPGMKAHQWATMAKRRGHIEGVVDALPMELSFVHNSLPSDVTLLLTDNRAADLPIYPGFLAVTFHELESIMTPFGL